MTKHRFTFRTEGSRTIVHWEGDPGPDKDRARGTSTGRYVDGEPEPPKRPEGPSDESEKKER